MHRLAPFLLIGMLGLAACGSRGPGGGAYAGASAAVECAPFARALSGVRLNGEAADWWWEADGRYSRQNAPAEGSVLVLRRSDRLPSGHVAVVSQVVSAREILVTQANWMHHHVTEDQPVVDMSPRNDWSLVRVWWPPAAAMGTTDYPAYGFIRPERPATHQQLTAAVSRAIRDAGG